MKNSKVLKTILFVSGLIGAGIGAAILFAPIAFYATYGIELGGNVSLLNEIRAPAGALLVGSIFVMSGAFVARLTFAAAVLSILFYLSYGLSRVLSMAIDGIPNQGLVMAAAFEIALGLACAFALVKYRAPA